MKTWLSALMAGAFLFLAPQAHAYIISHNGVDLGGTIGSGDVGVGLVNITESGLFGCDGGDIVCVEKLWFPGSLDQTSSITVTPESGDAPDFAFLEIVVNFTDVPWTDYHLSFSGTEGVACCEFAVLDESLQLVGFPDATGLGTSAVSFFFAPALQDFGVGGEILAFVAFITGGADGVTITQRPSVVPEPATLSLLGLGLIGLGLIRRRAA